MSIHPQIVELAGYIAQSRPEPERAPYVQSIRQRLAVGEGQTPLTKNLAWRREVFSVVFRDVKGLGEGAERGCVPFFFLHQKALPSHRSCNRNRGFLQFALFPLIDFMAYRLARNKESCVRPPAHHHLLDRRVCDQVPCVRFSPRSLSLCLALCLKFMLFQKSIEPLQHTSATIRAPSPGLQSAA